MKKWMPTGPEVVREAIIVMAGALLAFAVVQMLPPDWRKKFTLSGADNRDQA